MLRERIPNQRSICMNQLSLSFLFALTILLINLTTFAEAGRFHGYKKVFHREEHGDHKTYYDDLHHGKYKKSATDSREMFRKENKDERERKFGKSTRGGANFQESMINPIIVDMKGQQMRSQHNSPVKVTNPRELLWHEPADFKVKFSSAFEKFIASFNQSLF